MNTVRRSLLIFVCGTILSMLIPDRACAAGPIKPPVRQRNDPFSAAKNVTYICGLNDVTPAAWDTFKSELKRALKWLPADKPFEIFVLTGDSYISISKSELLPATPANLKKATEFIDALKPQKAGDIRAALREAWSRGSQSMYLLLDGLPPNSEATLQELAKLQARSKCKINTIAFMARDEKYEVFLKRIADESDGLFKFVTNDDLGASKSPDPGKKAPAAPPAGK